MEHVCLDTHILIWGIKEEATPGQELMIPKAKLFLKWLDDNKIKAIIPSVVISELLLPVPPELHNQVTDIFDQKFIVAPFDTAAASCFAKIWQSKNNDKTIQRLKYDYRTTKAELKTDCQIVAIAVSRKASCIISYDKKLTKFAEGYIEVKLIPDIPEQLNLGL